MHQQIRSEPRLSPPDMRRFLEKLADADVNVVAVGGGSLGHGGKVVIACHDEGGRDDTAKAVQKLRAEGYPVELVERGMNGDGYLHVGAMRNQKGELAREVREALKAAGDGYVVEDIAVGVPATDGAGETVYPVQIYCTKDRPDSTI